MDPKEGEGRRAARVERRLRGTDDAPSRSAWTSTSGSISPRTTRADARARRDIDRVCARAHPLRRIDSGAPPRRAVSPHRGGTAHRDRTDPSDACCPQPALAEGASGSTAPSDLASASKTGLLGRALDYPLHAPPTHVIVRRRRHASDTLLRWSTDPQLLALSRLSHRRAAACIPAAARRYRTRHASAMPV